MKQNQMVSDFSVFNGSLPFNGVVISCSKRQKAEGRRQK
jgi:hypothetical protein